MSVVRRRRDAVDALEHAMRGVQTTDPRPIERHDETSGVIGTRSDVRIDLRDLRDDDTPVEHEVTVVMRRLPRRERIR